jgi:aspartate 1-decarboxylase
MHRQMLKSKIHRATITAGDVDSDPTVLLGGVTPEQEALL